MSWFWKAILILAILYAIDRVGLWAEEKGWVYWRKKKPGASGFGNALGEFQAFLRPSAKHVIEVQQKKDIKEQKGQGEGIEKIRLAVFSEVKLLSQLSMRSKAYWPYDQEFIRDCEDDLRLDPRHFKNEMVCVHEINGKISGYYAFCESDGESEMIALFVEPELVGSGIGHKLWKHSIDFAKKQRWSHFKVVADPYAAEKFYLKLGCKQIGEIKSPVREGRVLPLLQFDVV